MFLQCCQWVYADWAYKDTQGTQRRHLAVNNTDQFSCLVPSLPLPAQVTLFLVRPTYASQWRDSTDCRSPIRYPHLGIIAKVSGFRNKVRNTLLHMDGFVIACRKRSILTSFKNKFRKARHACLITLTSTMQYANNSSLLRKKLCFCSSYHSKNWARSSPDM
jgi:hypothetical protein